MGRSLGQYAEECWREIWDVIGPLYAEARSVGATWSADLLLEMDRHGYREETYFTFSYSPIRDETGGVGGILITCAETTERVVGERRLRTLRELAAQSVVEAVNVEAACAASLGVLRRDDADLAFVLLYLAPGGRDPVLQSAVGGALAGAEAADWPLVEVLASGAPVRVADAAARFGPLPGGRWPEGTHDVLLLPVSSTGGPPDGVLVAGISPRRALDADYRGFLELVAGQVSAGLAKARAFAEARARADALAELDRAKTRFFSNVSHEFRTPLTLILGPLRDAIATGSALAGEDLQAAHRNALRLLRLTNTLLDFSRIEAGRIEACFQRTDLAGYTAELASTFRSLMDAAGLAFTIDCPPLGVEVYLDRGMWERVVLNLLSNAFKHTFAGGVTVRARLGGPPEAAPSEAIVEVTDTGGGIAPADLPRVFERFHRVQGARSRTHEGSGIGLALVQDLVRLHGGRLEAESEVGRGSCFRVRLPLGAAHLAPEHLGPDAETPPIDAAPYLEEAAGSLPSAAEAAACVVTPSAVESPEEPRARVLIADDNADMRGYVRRLLAPHWDVVTAPDGERALAEIRTRPPDLLLSDVMMPGLDGFQLLRAVRADPATRAMPVVLLSARAGEEARVGGLDAGADDYLVKPFTAEELLARVRSQVELGRLRRERQAEVERANAVLERRVAERTAALEETNAELASFTYTMAHDLRAPLRALERYSQALRDEYVGRPLDAAGQGYAQRIGVAARRMDALILSLLDYARIGRAEVARVRVGIAKLAEEVALDAQRRGAEIDVKRPIPPVLGDPLLLGQVLANLISNACKYTPPGSTAHVKIRGERRDGAVRVWVEDHGIGIDPEHHARIFRPFERLHGVGEYEGTGVGLAIVDRAITRMGGRVGVESTLGEGARFWFELPEAV